MRTAQTDAEAGRFKRHMDARADALSQALGDAVMALLLALFLIAVHLGGL